MTFGRLGQEDHVLVLITIGNYFRKLLQTHKMISYQLNILLDGSLIIKILKRTAEFTVETIDFYDRPNERSGSLQIPKKTKVFIEQTMRERENAPGLRTMKCSDI